MQKFSLLRTKDNVVDAATLLKAVEAQHVLAKSNHSSDLLHVTVLEDAIVDERGHNVSVQGVTTYHELIGALRSQKWSEIGRAHV